MREKFTFIKGFGRFYMIGDLGTVWSMRRNKPLRPAPQKGGYLKVTLYGYGKVQTWDVHRLVGLHHVKNHLRLNVLNHINRNILDNRSVNLRWVNHRENMTDTKKIKTSKFPGVSWHKNNRRWHSVIQVRGKKIFLGAYKEELAAALAYRTYCKEHYLVNRY